MQTGSGWQVTGVGFEFPPRLAQPSIAVKAGGRSRLFERSELRERRALREAQGTRVSGQASGIAFLLGTFLWRGKEKYLARMGEKRSNQEPRPSGQNLLLNSLSLQNSY